MNAITPVAKFKGMLFDPFGDVRPPDEYLLQPIHAIGKLTEVEEQEKVNQPYSLLVAGDICMEAANYAGQHADRSRLLIRAWLDWENGLNTFTPGLVMNSTIINTTAKLANIGIYRHLIVDRQQPPKNDSMKAYVRMAKLGAIITRDIYNNPQFEAGNIPDIEQINVASGRLATSLLLKRLLLQGHELGDALPSFRSENENVRTKGRTGWNISHHRVDKNGHRDLEHRLRVRTADFRQTAAQEREHNRAGITIVNPEADFSLSGESHGLNQTLTVLKECVAELRQDISVIPNLQARTKRLVNKLKQTKQERNRLSV